MSAFFGERTRTTLAGAALSLTLFQVGCGNGVTGGATERTVVVEEEWALGPSEAGFVDVRLAVVTGGTVDATAEWTLANNNVDIYVTAPACTAEMFAGGRCGFKARADSRTAKPERLSFHGGASESYRLWVVNLGPQRESGTFVVGVTPDS